jgi:hypothetical protein
MTVVGMGGKVDVDRIGESDTRNDEDVVANDVMARRTGEYEELGDPVIVLGVSTVSSSSICCRFRFLAL